MYLLALATAFTSLNGMRYKMSYEFLEKYSKESGIPLQVLIATICIQVIAALLFVCSYSWPIVRTIAALIELPSPIVGAYVSAMKPNPTQRDISFFNLQVLAAAICLFMLF